MLKPLPLRLMILALSAISLPAIAAEQGNQAQAAPKTVTGESPSPSALSPIDGVVGHFGLGYFTENAPIGIRYWLDRKFGIDLGFDAAFSSGNVDGYRLGIDAGAVYALAHYHYSVVFARIGLGYLYEGVDNAQPTPGTHQVSATTFLGAELFLGALGFPNISLQGGYGLTAAYSGGGGSAFIIGTSSAGLNVIAAGTLGFHIYL